MRKPVRAETSKEEGRTLDPRGKRRMGKTFEEEEAYFILAFA